VKILRRLVFVSVAVLLFAFPADCKTVTRFEEADSQFVFGAMDILRENYYDPGKLNERELLNAGLDGIAKILKFYSVSFQPKKISGFFPGQKPKTNFINEFERAKALAKKTKVPKHHLAFAAAAAMLDLVGDSHTYFIFPEVAEEINLRERHEPYVGIGVELAELEAGYIYFKMVFSGSPAQKAGLKKFDRLISVDGVPFSSKVTVSKAVDRIKGEKGTKVKIGFLRGGKFKQVSIVRDNIIAPSVEKEAMIYAGKSVGYVQVSQLDFFAMSVQLVIDDLVRQGVKGLVLDLRDNPGGFLMVVNNLLGLFLPPNTPIYSLIDRQGVKQFTTADDFERRIFGIKKELNLPLAVLINKNSASGSEIIAAILQEYKTAVIVGEKSAGAVSVGKKFQLLYGAEMNVTIQEFRTVKGKRLEKIGVIPDNEVKFTKKDVVNGIDVQLQRALEILNNKIAP
jgi:carboxyl-terminal processing protease